MKKNKTSRKLILIPSLIGLILALTFCFAVGSMAAGALVPPDNVYAENIASGKALVSWNQVNGAASYNVLRYDFDNDKYITVGTTKECQFEEEGLANGQTYYYCVQSVNGKTVSDYSDIVPVDVISSVLKVTYWTSTDTTVGNTHYYSKNGTIYSSDTTSSFKQLIPFDGSQNILSNEDIKLSRTGYKFNGWALYVKGYKDSNTSPVSVNMTTYYTNSSVLDSSKITNIVQSYFAAEAKKSDGYKPYYNIDLAKGDVPVIIVARWTPITYSITYKWSSGTLPVLSPTTYKYATAVTLPTPSVTGYVFEGWFSDSALTQKISSIGKTDLGNKTFYAKFRPVTYSIKYYVDGVEIPSFAQSEIKYGDNVTLKKYTEKNRYVTSYWYTSRNSSTFALSGNKFSQNGTAKNLSTKDGAVVTLHANTYVKLRFSGGTSVYAGKDINGTQTAYQIKKMSGASNTYLMKNDSMVEYVIYKGATVSKTKIDNGINSGLIRSKDGYMFTGWNSKADGSGMSVGYSGSGTYSFNTIASFANSGGNAIVFAQFAKRTFTIKCDQNEGTGGTSVFYEAYNSQFYTDTSSKTEISAISIPKRTGFKFGGYYTSESANNGTGTQVINASGRILKPNSFWDSDTTVYAKWTPDTYAVNFKWSDGSTISQVAASTYTYGQDYQLPGVPVISGLVVEGWYSDAACTKSISLISSGKTGAVTVYAKKHDASIYYTVKYISDGYVMTAETQTCYYGQTYQTPVVTYSNALYHATNWNTKSDGTGVSFTQGESFKNLSETKGDVIYLYSHKELNGVNLCLKKDNKQWTPAASDKMTLTLVLKSNTNVVRQFNETSVGGMYNITNVPNGEYLIYAPLTKGSNPASTEKYLDVIKVGSDLSTIELNYYSVTVKKGSNVSSVSGGTGWIIKGGTRTINCTANTGYHFTKWSGTKNGSSTSYTQQKLTISNVSDPYVLTANTAANTYTVQYMVDGSLRSELSQSGTYGKELTLRKYTEANRKTTVWYPIRNESTGALSGTPTYSQGQKVTNLSSVNNAVITLYARTYVTIRYSANTEIYSGNNMTDNVPTYIFQNISGGSTYTYLHKYNTTNKAYALVQVNVMQGNSMNCSSIMTATTSGISGHVYGHSFNGWNTNVKGTGLAVKYASTGSISFDKLAAAANSGGNVIVYTQWKANASTLKVVPNGGTWNKKTTAQSFTGNYNTTKAIPLPTVGPKVTITFNGNGGSTSSSVIERKFVKWTRTNSYGKMSTLTAAATYTYGATASVTDTLTANYGSVKGTFPTSTRTGYTFMGWAESKTATTAEYKAGDSTPDLTENKTYYAVWKPKTYSVAYKYSDGTTASVNGSKIRSFGSEFKLPEVPTKSGYVVEGWYLTQDCSGEKISVIAANKVGNLVLYAKITKK